MLLLQQEYRTYAESNAPAAGASRPAPAAPTDGHRAPPPQQTDTGPRRPNRRAPGAVDRYLAVAPSSAAWALMTFARATSAPVTPPAE